MKYLIKYRLFESLGFEDVEESERYIRDILQELEDDGFEITIDKHISRVDGEKNRNLYFEVYIKRPRNSPPRVIPGVPEPFSTNHPGKYPGDIFLWKEVKDPVIRLVEWYYSNEYYTPGINYNISKKLKKIGIKVENSSPFRFFNSGVEFGIGWSSENDFSNLSDTISFTSLKLLIKMSNVNYKI
jgi:hypothetical protein